ncbi:hypothetical protein [Cellulomonas sp.]|uniref:hypothetical protein n=1 Tax=Cellulomonas sp. TaxID=40001 RepID=UPI0025837E55|nr:hypothetical protein [Cellulomonas sp.]MCR6688856.1 hypothetical protein [Cellulomonas sp.]
MTAENLPVLPTQSSHLLARWRDESVASVWRRPSDWYHPAVDELALALLLRDDPVPAAARLGQARGDMGVGIAEAIDDLACLYRTTTSAEPPLSVVRALCTGWADASAAPVHLPVAQDAESGLPTGDYLRLRVAECYPDGSPQGDLLVVDVAAGVPDPFSRMARQAAVGAVLRELFGTAQPMASLGGGTFVVLLRPGQDVTDAVDSLPTRIAAQAAAGGLEDVTRSPLRTWTEPLPPTADEAAVRLRRLART